MSSPVLHLLAGPNGSGKSTLVERVLSPSRPGLVFVNADVIASQRWPGEESTHAYEASRAAAEERDRLLGERVSFITETVFSHPSKVGLIKQAVDLGYLVHLHVVLVPEDLTVVRVSERVRRGGHTVPEEKIRARYQRLWPLIVHAARLADRTDIYDNTSAATPFREVASLRQGRSEGVCQWPSWTPEPLRSLG